MEKDEFKGPENNLENKNNLFRIIQMPKLGQHLNTTVIC